METDVIVVIGVLAFAMALLVGTVVFGLRGKENSSSHCEHCDLEFLERKKNREADRFGYPSWTYRYRCKKCKQIVEYV